VATVGSGYPRYYFTWNEVCNGNNNPKTFTIGGEDFTLLTKAEWEFLLGLTSGRSSYSASGHFYVKATVNSKFGLIILPDNWSDSNFSFTNYNSTATVNNTVTAADWLALEGHGAVFLPAAGCITNYLVSTDRVVWFCPAESGTTQYAVEVSQASSEILFYARGYTSACPMRLVRVK